MKKPSLINRLFASLFKMRMKLTLPTVLMIAGSAGAISYAIYDKTATLKAEKLASIGSAARAIQDKIDRNLFERYGDVQAFALNTAVHRDLSDLDQTSQDAITQTINGYVTGYGCYALSLVVDTSGKIAAINTVDALGEPLHQTKDLVRA